MIKYTKDHEWITGPHENDTYLIGVSPFAVNELSDIVFIDLLDEPDFHMNDVFGSIEAVKTVSDVFAPVGCTLFDINTDVIENPELLTPETALDSWFIKVLIDDVSELDKLMSEEQYKDFTTG